jgi:predicted nucleotidyltransferase
VSDPTGIALARVAEVLRSHGVEEFAFTGGVAVGVWALPRQTHDVDVCGALPVEEVNRLLAQRDGLRSGPSEMPDLVRFRVGDWDVDLFVSKDPYDAECLARAVSATIDGTDVRVVTAEDLLIHKMIKLRTDRRRLLQDLADIRAVIVARAGELDPAYLKKWLPTDEAELLESVAAVDDEELVRRLLRRP